MAALARICKHKGSAFNVNEVLPVLLTLLPVTVDEDEAGPIYEYFCDLVESSNPAILGANNANLPTIVHVLAEAVTCDVMSAGTSTLRRCMTLLRTIHTQIPPASHDMLWSKVDQGIRVALIAEFANMRA